MTNPLVETQHLLVIAAEECAETAVEISKALRFGPNEIYEGQKWTNWERVQREFIDLTVVMEQLTEKLGSLTEAQMHARYSEKSTKLAHYMDYSRQIGELT